MVEFAVIVKAVIFLVLLALGGYFFVLFRRRNWFLTAEHKDKGPDTLQVVRQLPIGGRSSLAIIRCNQQKFLIGVSPSGITAIGELQATPTDSASFGKIGAINTSYVVNTPPGESAGKSETE
ncbi:MAG: flagellar biosynthetic protein FliO [Verrucomicrobiota bacterium]|nr:MAG: flagellar biosynthetic protein FliO [Verrucomicrobiota bacterium]